MRLFLLLLFSLLAPVAIAQPLRADMQCKPAGKDLVYDCVIRLARAGEPLTGAQLSVGADMPSMPMAHNVKPVKARPGNGPGEYLARLDLEMQGEWAVKLRLAGPVRDQLVLHYEFDERGARPVRRSGTAPRN
jgi:hypothetical protein